MTRRGRGLQLEIVASLFVVMLAGVSIVAVVMASLAIQTVQRGAFDQLELGSQQLRRTLLVRELALDDLAAVIRSQGGHEGAGTWQVLDASGRPLLASGDALRSAPGDLLGRAQRAGRATSGSGVTIQDVVWVERITAARGEVGFLLGSISAQRLESQLDPLLRSGAWVLVMAASVFVVFGSYLLRKRIVEPVRELSAATRRVAEGELGVRTPARGSDELSDLARQFNHMAESLEQERERVLRAFESLARSQRLATVGQLAAGVAHEVGNPVAAILGYVDVAARDKGLPERARASVEHIRKEALRIRGLVRQLLDLARPEPRTLGRHAPRELLERAHALLRPQKILSGVELRLDVDPSLPPVVTDPRCIEQVLINLVENAAHALRGSEEPRIVLRARVRDMPFQSGRRRSDAEPLARAASLVIDVHDNGPGIDPELCDRIFDPFFTTKDPGEGTGLGLWNAHRLAEWLGGRLELRSEPGSTCFSLILPLTDTQDEAHERPSDPDHR